MNNTNPNKVKTKKTRKVNSKNARRLKALRTESRLRVALYYAFQLLVDAFIILVFIKGFSMSYNFSHDVFFDSAKNLKNTEYVSVTIDPDSSTKTIATKIFEAGVVKNKYVLMAKIKVNELGGKIKAGTYPLSQSMTYNEILAIISEGASLGDVQYKTEEEDKTKFKTPTDATEIHDNSLSGAGSGTEGAEGGASEGDDDYVPEGGDDASDEGSGEDGESAEE